MTSEDNGSINIINLKFKLDNSSGVQTSRSTSLSSQDEEDKVGHQSLGTDVICLLGEVQKQISRLENKIDNNDTQVRSMSRDMENRDKRMEKKMKSDKLDFSAKLEQVLDQVKSRNSQDDLKGKYNHLQETLRQVREKLNKKDEKIRTLLQELSAIRKEISKLTESIEIFRADIEEKNKIIEEKVKILESLKKENQENIDRCEKEIQWLKDEIINEEKKVTLCEKKQHAMTEEIKRKDKKVQDLEKEKIELTVENDLRRQEADKLLDTVMEIAENRANNGSDFMTTDQLPTPTELQEDEGACDSEISVKISAAQVPAKSKPSINRDSKSSTPTRPELAFVGTKPLSASKHKDFKTPINSNIIKARKAITDKTGEKNRLPRK